MISKPTYKLNEELQKLKAENKQLRDKINYATGYVANTLMEHNVSSAFVKNYTKNYGETEWVSISYVKEIFEIIAQPIKQSDKPKEMENK